MGTLRDSARTGRDLFWTFKGMDQCGGGFLGLFLFKLLERNQKRKAQKPPKDSKTDRLFDAILDNIEKV